MDGVLPKADSLSPIEVGEGQFEPSFDEENNPRSVTVKRPMNAFLLWARGERKRMSSDGYGVSQTSLSKLLGETWRHMSMEEKQPFLDMAETLKRQHHLDHPDYRFKPKQRSTTGNKAIAKKHQTPIPQQAFSSLICSPTSSSSSSSSHSHCSQTTSSSSSMSTATPHPIQSSVLAMCYAIVPSTSNPNDDWFGKLTEQPLPVIVAPYPRSQASPQSSRRAVRIQIINKHDDIAVSAPTSLPMTPSPQASCRHSSFPIDVDESTPTLADYLACGNSLFHPQDHQQQGLEPVMDTSMGYETFHESSTHHFTDLDHHSDQSGWIDTPLSNLGTNSTDLLPSPYASYDFLCL